MGPDADPLLDLTADLMAFLWACPSPYHAVEEAARRLSEAGFVEGAASGRWMVRRGGALIAGVCAPGVPAPVRIIGAHTDSPNLRVKPRPDTGLVGWRQIGVEVYGGILANSWLDRDLGLSGRVVLRDGSVRLLRIDDALARVPQLAIHLDREVGERGLILDKQAHLAPVWGLGPVREGDFVELVARALAVSPHEVISYDLMFHDLTPPSRLGVDAELLASARIDNLASCHAAIRALISVVGRAEPLGTAPVLALFDHEEVGSSTATGADGPMLERALVTRGISVEEGLCVSADMAHSVHPNYPERHDPMHRPLPNGGPVLKVNASQRYATDAMTAAAFIGACERAAVPHQLFVSRNNMPCGSTIGPITSTRLGIATVDVGCAMLSMHSARELMGAHDQSMYVAALTECLAR